MYLSGIEIFGFKSFANKTNIRFNEGITAIVGPNGCGKTNIVDALRWCLGEQKSNMLRSDKMENVIFNGTSARKPMGMAEVSLTIHNTKGILPTEYTDITITRRIFRSGESEYLLNKNLCRLKDITNLFMDTGIGANAYSVIELKMVETILSNKADERRMMFEEAAGVKKYKHRRRLALRKLDEVKNDLTRVNDIVSEVTKKVNSLERQAKKADRYNKFSSTLRELELDYSERELALFDKEIKTSKVSREKKLIRKGEIESQMSILSGNLNDLKRNLEELETELNMKRSEISAQTEKVYSHQSAVSISEERKNSLGKNIERYSGEISELENQKNQSIELIKNGEEEISGIFDQIESSVKKIGELSSNLNGYKTKLEEKQSVYKSGSEELIEKLKVVSGKENELDNLEKKLDEKKKIINKLNDKILGITNNVAKTVGYIEDLDNERKSVNEKIKLSEETYSQKQEEKENLEKQLNDLKTKELELKSTINNVRDKIIFIQDLVENLEGFSAGSKALVENSGWNKKEAVLLANSGNATSEYRIAVEAALKNNLNNILIESLDDLKSGIEYLKKNEAGKASFYFYRNGRSNQKGLVAGLERWNVKRSKKKLRKVKDVYGFAPEFVQTATKWKPYFDSLLENVVIVENLETALQLSGKFGFFKFVTKEGDYIDSNGIIEAGSVPRVDDSLFGRKQLLDELKNELPSYQNKLSEIEKQIEDIDSRINSIDLKDISERGRMLLNDLANIEKQIAQFEFEKNKFNDEIETTHIQVRELAAESVNIDNERLNVNEELEKLIEDRMSTEKSLSDIENAVIEIDHEYKSAIESHNNEKLLLERLQGDKRNLENRKENAENNINSIKNTIERRKEDINRANDEIKNIEIDIEKKSIELKDLLNIKDSMQVEVGKIEEEHSTLRVKVNQQDNNLNELRNEKESISDEMHSIDIKLNELKLKSENLIEHIKENYSLKLEHKQFADLDTFNFTEQNAEVHMLKDKIKNLGPINLLAYSEYEEEKQRQDFLLKQREDLLESEKDIVKTIEEINNTAQEKFTNTFELIRGHFIEIFRGLFNPGDEADLRLEENVDPLEAKIEIIAKPKGKRPTSIDLLSGGEKTLTAIALLFAIYLVKPSPFCILDEIDAPLDDANIDRFTKILEDFSSDTQFIVVTHNKRTMEAAQTMYGVTMQDEGVSKLVSVLFNEDFDFVAQG